MAGSFVGIIGAVVGKIGDYLAAPITRQFTYMCCFNSNFKELETQLKDLETTREGVQMAVDDYLRKVRVIGPNVQEWMNTANEVTSEVKGIIQDKSEVKEECLNKWWCPNLKLRYSLSRKAVKKTEVVVELKATGGQYTKTSYSPLPACMETIPNTKFSGFESRKLNMEEILKALTDDEFKLIGICGLPGVGKTTMVQEVKKRAVEEKLFDEVGFVVVGQKPYLTNVQKCIADHFGLADLGKHDDPTTRANLLRKRLSQDKMRILLILDDVWEEFDLEDQGIPLGVFLGTFKIIYTSRSQRLWHYVPTKKEIALGLLLEEEAWQLFKDKAGVVVDAPELQPIAKLIVKECGRLPLALVIIGSTLSKKSGGKVVMGIWKDMLRRLTSSSSSSSADESLYSKLKLSYDVLDVEAKHLFLLCCLFKEDKSICIEDLARYGLGLSFFDGINGISEVRDRVSYLVDDLKSRYLMLDGDEDACVKVHDVVRGMGIYIASRDKDTRALVSHGDVSEWPKKDTCEHCTYISVISQNITELPEGLTCPKLEFLLLQCSEVEKLPCNFFERMEKLKVLELHNFDGILSLQSLRNLHTLSLEGYGCGALDNVSVIRELHHLEILSFRYSWMEELPEEIGELNKLRLLDLRYTNYLERISAGVISRLSHLEEVYMVGSSFRDWEGEDEEEAGRNANLSEFESLPNLSTLEIMIRDDVRIPKRTTFSKLQRYNVQISTRDHWQPSSYKKQLLVGFALTPIPSDVGGIDSLLRSADSLILEGKGCNDLVGKLLRDFWVDGLQQLKNLSIKKCDTPECHANTTNPVQQPTGTATTVFPILEKLNLNNLPNLREIWCGPVRAGSFGKLTSIDVSNCGRLRNLFQLPIVGCLTPLKGLSIDSRDVVEEVISKKQREDVRSVATSRIEFPKLESLELSGLPSLLGFCGGTDEIDFPQLKDLVLRNLRQFNLLFHENNNISSNGEQNNNVGFRSLFSQKVTFPSLEKLILEGLQNVSHIWSSELLIGSFCKLKHLEVAGCASSKNLFQLPIARCLTQLERLTISSCNMMEEVIWKEQREDLHNVATNRIEFPKLEYLELENLPSLVGFCRGIDEIDFPQLKKLVLRNLPQMNSLVHENNNVGFCSFFPQKVTFPSLDDLVLGLQNASHICRSEFTIRSFSKLKSLEVTGCASSKNLFMLPIAGCFTQLERLKITSCDIMEEIIWKEQREDVHDVATNRIEFSKLETLELENLPSIVGFCKGIDEIDFPQLKELVFVRLPQINNMSSNSEQNNNVGSCSLFLRKVTFPSLEYLILIGLPNVSHIWSNELPTMSSFVKLKNLFVFHCGSLSNMFHPSMARVLVNLQTLYIWDCSKMEAVVGLEEEVEEGQGCKIVKTLFPQLRELRLENLPNLKGFCHFTHSLELPLLTWIEIRACPHMEAFSVGHLSAPKLSLADVSWNDDLNNVVPLLKEVKFPSLENLLLQDLPNVSHIWSNELPIMSTFAKLQTLDVYGCERLSKMFHPSMAGVLVNLQELIIENCSKMEAVVGFEEEVEEGQGSKIIKTLFPQLRVLTLKNLPNLRRFCHFTHSLELALLTKIKIRDCPHMEAFSVGYVSAPKLSLADVSWTGDLNNDLQLLKEYGKWDWDEDEDGDDDYEEEEEEEEDVDEDDEEEEKEEDGECITEDVDEDMENQEEL